MTTSDEFYIFSLRWTREDYATWWCPNNSGYTSCLEQAGRYSRERVEGNPGYYNNGVTTLAIPCSEVEAEAVRVVFDWSFRKLTGKFLKRVLDRDEDDCTCPSCGVEPMPTILGLRVAGADK